MIIFFKVRERVKKAVFTGETLDDLNALFLEKFPDFPRYNTIITKEMKRNESEREKDKKEIQLTC